MTMLRERMDSAADCGPAPWRQTGPGAVHCPGECVAAALITGGDSRLDLGRLSGVNKYLCPPVPAPDLVCVSSCTASPVSVQGFRAAADAYVTLNGRAPARRLDQATGDAGERLLRYCGAAGLAKAILCPSGTDALMIATTLVALEQPGMPITAILPQASETGSGVPLAVAGQWFDGEPPSGWRRPGYEAHTIAIPLRGADGVPLADEDVSDAYAAAAAPGRAIVYLTHGTKTGLIAPVALPAGDDVVVDACQGRIEPETIVAYLRRGWPVVITGSKFFGGPAFSGAVLFPVSRLTQAHARHRPVCERPTLGSLLRWIAALESIEAFAPLAAAMPAFVQARSALIEQGLAANPALISVRGRMPGGSGWAGLPGIFTFAVRDPADRRRLLTAAALRPLYERLAREGILLGQPVDLGRFGGLRIAIGARDIGAGALADDGLQRLFSFLGHATA